MSVLPSVLYTALPLKAMAVHIQQAHALQVFESVMQVAQMPDERTEAEALD